MRGFYPSLIIIRNFYENVLESSVLSQITEKQIKSFKSLCPTTEIVLLSCSLVNSRTNLWNIVDKTNVALESSGKGCTRIIINNVDLHGPEPAQPNVAINRLVQYTTVREKLSTNIITYTFDSSCYVDRSHPYSHFEDAIFSNLTNLTNSNINSPLSLTGTSLIYSIAHGDLTMFDNLRFMFPLCTHDGCYPKYSFSMCRDINGYGKMWSITVNGVNFKVSPSHFMNSYLLYNISHGVLPCCQCYDTSLSNFSKHLGLNHMFSSFNYNLFTPTLCECKSPVIREMVRHAFDFSTINYKYYRRYKDLMYLVHPAHQKYLSFSSPNLQLSAINVHGKRGVRMEFIEPVRITNTYDKDVAIVLTSNKYVRPRRKSGVLKRYNRIDERNSVVLQDDDDKCFVIQRGLYILSPGHSFPIRVIAGCNLNIRPTYPVVYYGETEITSSSRSILTAINYAGAKNIRVSTDLCRPKDLKHSLRCINEQSVNRLPAEMIFDYEPDSDTDTDDHYY